MSAGGRSPATRSPLGRDRTLRGGQRSIGDRSQRRTPVLLVECVRVGSRRQAPKRKDHVSILWIIIIVILVLAVLGYFGRGRFSR